MKISAVLLATFFLSCSIPKYTYFYNQANDASSPVFPPEKDGVIRLQSESVIASLEQISTSAVKPPEDSAAALTILHKDIKSNSRATEISKEQTRQQVRSAIRELRKANRERVPNNQSKKNKTPNPKNNGFAIAGFVLSLAGLYLWPLLTLGIIFSAIGLNSERRGLAIAGLIIGVVVVIVAVIMLLMLLSL